MKDQKSGMNSQKVNWMYIAMFVSYIAISYGLSWYVNHYGLKSVYPLYLINEVVYLLPMVLFVVCSGSKFGELLCFRRMKVSTALMTVLFTFLCMPLTTVLNLFTQFFVENTVEASSDVILQMPFAATFLLMAVYAPVCEEIIFRGVAYEASKRGLNVFQAMCVSAVFFGLAHMNFNQAAYAITLGIILVLLKEATGSLWATILFHLVFNGYNVVLMYLQPKLEAATSEATQVLEGTEYREILLQSISIYMVIALITTALAGCVLAWIAGNEERKEQLCNIWRKRKENRGKLLRIPFILALSLYLGMMLADALWL